MTKAVWVVPCFNEEKRLDASGFADLLRDDRVHLLFVDDGSTDGTARTLAAMIERWGERATVLRLGRNVGKGEAVRRGLRAALASGADAVGYLDADLAIPPSEAQRIVNALFDNPTDAVLASRALFPRRRSGHRTMRTVLGRTFAVAASLALRKRIRDTQCGAKMFRPTDALDGALSTQFRSRWIFDVELLGRMLANPSRPPELLELPLDHLKNGPNSRLRASAMLRAGIELAWIARDLSTLRREQAS